MFSIQGSVDDGKTFLCPIIKCSVLTSSAIRSVIVVIGSDEENKETALFFVFKKKSSIEMLYKECTSDFPYRSSGDRLFKPVQAPRDSEVLCGTVPPPPPSL